MSSPAAMARRRTGDALRMMAPTLWRHGRSGGRPNASGHECSNVWAIGVVREYEKPERPVTGVTGRSQTFRCTRCCLRAPRRGRWCGARGERHRESTAIAAALLVGGGEQIRAVLAAGRGAGGRRAIRSRRLCGVERGLPRGGRRRRRVGARGLPHGLRLLRGRDGRPHGVHGCAHAPWRDGRGPQRLLALWDHLCGSASPRCDGLRSG